jgi:hypothetical protein
MTDMEYADNDIRNVIFENINDKYAYGKFGDFNVIIMKDSGYINASKICKDADKEFRHWNANNYTNQLIDTLSSNSGISRCDLMIQNKGGSSKDAFLRGTYVHPKLIVHIASWCSPEYALKVSDIVNEYHIKEAVEEKEKLLKKKQDKIDKLSNKVDLLLFRNDKLLNKNDELLNNNNKQLAIITKINKDNETQSVIISKMDNRIKKLLAQNEELCDQNDEMSDKINSISNDRVVSTNDSNDNHMLIVIKNNGDPDDVDEDETYYEYYAMRVMKRACMKRIYNHKEKFPQMQILLKINFSPNSINLWKRIKLKLGTGAGRKMKICGSQFNIRSTYTETELVSDIKKVHNERFVHDDDDDSE